MKTKLLPVFLFLFFSVCISAQNSWSPKANFGGTKRTNACAFSIGNKIYVGTGYDDSIGYRQDFWEWDPSTNVWTQKANVPGNPRSEAVAFSIGNKGYIGTGKSGAGVLNDFYEYDPSTDTWTPKATFTGAVRRSAVGFSVGNKGYIGTGTDYYVTTVYNDFYEYDPVNDSWAQKSNVPGVPRQGAVGFGIGEKGYVGTGATSAYICQQDFWEWDQATDTWVQKANFPGVVRYYAVGFSIGNKGYIGTGFNNGFYLQDFYEWNQVTNTWTQKTNNTNTRWEAIGVSTCTKGYIGMGANNNNITLFKDFAEYSPSAAPAAAFTSSGGACVNFTDVSTNVPTSWNWSFPGGNPSSSTAQNPTNICYSGGTYTVTLTASNANCTSTTTQTITVVGINEQADAENIIALYPNPSTGKFTLDPQVTTGEISIYNLFGELIFFSRAEELKGGTIDLSGQPNGIYLVGIKTGKSTSTQKLVIAR